MSGYLPPANPNAYPNTLTSSEATAGKGSQLGDPSLIYQNNKIPQTDMLRPFNVNPAGRGANYNGPVVTPDVTQIHLSEFNNAGYNQLMMELAQNFDPMIQQSVMAQPRWWHDRIARSAYTLFNGATHETRIYRGGLMKYAGLSQWVDIDPRPYNGGGDPKKANDPCAALPYETYKYGWESLSWSGKKAAWGSDPICLDMFKFFNQATQQLAWILSTGAEYGIQMQEVWNRDMFIYQSVSFGRSYIMTSKYDGPASPRYYYDPFIKFDATKGTESQGHMAAETIGRAAAFIVIDASVEIEPLNFDVLDQVRESLKIRCPKAAVSNNGGEPMFALAVSHDDVERYIRGNEEERKYWIEANPQALIQHYGFAPSTFRRWMITNDGNQLRFKITDRIESYDPTPYGEVAKELEGKPVYIAVAVDPLIASETRIGIDGSPIPEDNPEYYKAELAIAPVFMNQVFTNQFVPAVTSLGSGTKFGPVAGLNGNWGWLNIRDRETNPLGNIGNFYGQFEIVPKPETHVVHTTSFLYRRCTSALPSICPSQNIHVNTTGTKTSKVAVAAKIPANQTTVTVVFEDQLLAEIGDIVKITIGEAPVNAFVIGSPTGYKKTLQVASTGSERTITVGTEATVL